jgi:hypothetical protein
MRESLCHKPCDLGGQSRQSAMQQHWLYTSPTAQLLRSSTGCTHPPQHNCYAARYTSLSLLHQSTRRSINRSIGETRALHTLPPPCRTPHNPTPPHPPHSPTRCIHTSRKPLPNCRPPHALRQVQNTCTAPAPLHQPCWSALSQIC